VKKGTAKKGASGNRGASRGSRSAARPAAAKAKAVERTSATNQGAHRGMSTKNKKTTTLRPAEAVTQPVLPRATQRQGFKTNEFIVYPAHGVGQIVAIEEQEVAGYKLELFVINFVKDKMTLRVPTAKIASVGMRKLAEPPMVRRALETLKGRARIKRTMWSRRAQEYEAKINSGDIVAIAEVVRDLYRSESQPEQSYSERQLYEAALDRLSREISAVQRITETEAVKEIEAALAKGPRRGGKPGEGDGAIVEDEAA
jgi:CarD family transcriptional regulator